MQLAEAIRLIQNERLKNNVAQQWADLGCGSGLFTNALATLLYDGSVIYAIDKDISSFKNLNNKNKIIIRPIQLDFVGVNIGLNELDGVLMANSLHYVKDKVTFIKKVSSAIKVTGSIIIVEYDTDIANPWVPYPVSFAALRELLLHEGYKEVVKLQEHSSVYGRANIYSAIIR